MRRSFVAPSPSRSLAGVGLTPPYRGEWSAPVALYAASARLAAGTNLHCIAPGATGIEHRRSSDQGATWGSVTTIPSSSGELVPLYGPIAVNGSTVHVLSRSGSSLVMRRSTDGGVNWSSSIALAGYSADASDRVQVDVDGVFVHVFCGRAGDVPDATFKNYYWRSTDEGVSWSGVTVLDDVTGPPSPGGIAAEGGVVHIAYAAILPDVGSLGHRARYLRSADNGATWGSPVDVSGGITQPQIRPRPRVADGRVIVMWEEPSDHNSGAPYPNATRGQIRQNRSLDNGVTFEGVRSITAVSDIYPNHPEIGIDGPRVHVAYRLSADQATLADTDRVGYRLSLDYGASWHPHEYAIDLPTVETHMYNAVPSADFAHLLVGGDGGSWYHSRRTLPEASE